MRLSHISLSGFKSFAKKTTLDVSHNVTGVVGPNGSGKSNISEAIRFVLGEQSMKSMRGKTGSDVIFKGSEKLQALSRASVTMVIDNRQKPEGIEASQELAPFLVYDELTLSRTIYADGTSDYILNDAKIRLKDVQELLSYAGIGGSVHTIISQGQADTILLASPQDKKEALLDALGLRVYQMRLQESGRKLERVKSHVHEVELLRNEIKPHISHLERQVKKIENQAHEREQLSLLLLTYFAREEKELTLLSERIEIEGTSSSLLLITDSIHKELESIKAHIPDIPLQHITEKQTLTAELQNLLTRKEQTIKTIGRLEAEKKYIQRELEIKVSIQAVEIPHEDFITTHTLLSERVHSIEQSVTATNTDEALLHVDAHKHDIEMFFMKYSIDDGKQKKDTLLHELPNIEEALTSHMAIESTLSLDIIAKQQAIDDLTRKQQEEKDSRHDEEKKVMILESKLRELKSTIALRQQEEHELALRKSHFDSLLQEGVVIVGQKVLSYRDHTHDARFQDTPLSDLLRAIERSKLRIEESSVQNSDEVMREYKQAKERDDYLVAELADIKASEEKLTLLINELTKSVREKLQSGVEEVSRIFGEFFGEIFIGGKARIDLVNICKIDDEGVEHVEQGIDIDVTLPNKKVKELAMFSGGERTIVSIALLFAMSSITPPPFMVLDETDAPLDEANARKYGMMLKRLAEKSKLLVITHNRETMNYCDMLYGVTIGIDGASRLLSIDFKEAEAIVS